jgi:hypothetical protein
LVWAGASATLAGQRFKQLTLPGFTINISSSVTLYLVAQAGFTVGTVNVSGFVTAERIR